MISGNKINLRPATLNDRENIYEWLANSDITSSIMGPPDFPDNEIPDKDYFINDYEPAFFNDDDPYSGRSYIIEKDSEPVGHINYNEFKPGQLVELDIWLSASKHCGHGYGTEAILLLCEHLKKNLNCREFMLAPSARNVRAIKVYEKAGFQISDKIPESLVPDYYDTVVMIKKLSPP